MPQGEPGKISCVRHSRCGRLSPGACAGYRGGAREFCGCGSRSGFLATNIAYVMDREDLLTKITSMFEANPLRTKRAER